MGFGHIPLHIQKHLTDHSVGRYQACLLGNVLGTDFTGHIHTVHNHVLLAFFIVFDLNRQLVDVALHTVGILGADAQKV